jgi:hypothetical protein
MQTYLSRVCWNTDGWSRPSGVAHLAEGSVHGSSHTFVSDTRYGHEEWLFRPEHTLDGWRYGFLQPALKSRKHQGHTLNVELYTIDPQRRRLYLGRIDELVVLTDAEASSAFTAFERNGWLAAMYADLADLGLPPPVLGNMQANAPFREIVNVRFRLEHVHMLPEAREADVGDVTKRPGKNRYLFYPLSKIAGHESGIAPDPKRPTSGYSYETAPIVKADRRHNQLQLKLSHQLRGKYGHHAVRLEENGIDIVLTRTDGVVYIEVKSQPDPRLAIREALGQLLEYALFARPGAALPELVVVAPGEPGPAVNRYVHSLSSELQIPLRYVSFHEHTRECPL